MLQHKCKGSAKNAVSISKMTEYWHIEWEERVSLSDPIDVCLPIGYCPFCGVKLDES